MLMSLKICKLHYKNIFIFKINTKFSDYNIIELKNIDIDMYQNKFKSKFTRLNHVYIE